MRKIKQVNKNDNMQNYNFRKIKSKASYNTTEIKKVLEVDRRTIRRWVKNEGLEVVDSSMSSILVMGADLIKFIKSKRLKRKMPANDDEYLCFKCHKVVKAKAGSEQIIKTGKRIGKNNKEQFKKTGNCEHCGTKLNKFLGVYQRD